MRKLVVLFLALGLVGVVYADSPFAGTWKLNVAKSKLASDPDAPKAETATVTENKDTGDVTAQGTDMNGKAFVEHFTYPLSGGAVKYLEGGPTDGTTESVKMVDANTMHVTFVKDGKEVGTERITVSPDGKTMRIMEKGTSPDGKPYSGEFVFEKQ
jgi:hypothetical protein